MTRLRSTPEAGFTLLELLAALVIAATVLVIAIPVVTGSHSARAIRDATSVIVAVLDETRNRAMISGKPMNFAIDPDQRSYRSDDGDATALPFGMNFLTPSGPHLIVFRPDGTATPTEFGLRKGRASVRIGIDWLTGRTSVAFER